MQSLRTALGITALALAAPAQQTRVVPAAAATRDGSTATPYFSGYGAGRAQQVVDGAALCRVTAVLRALALRADGRRLVAIPSRGFAQLKLTIGYTSRAPASMSATFAANRTGPQTVIFSGAYNLPAQNATSRPFNIVWKLATPFVYARAKGNLLVEFEIPGRPQKANYFLDAHRTTGTGGSCVAFGKAGQFKRPETYRIQCTNPATLVPGGRIALVAASFSQRYPALFVLGFSNTRFGPIKLPFDLTALGAPGNWVHVSIDAVEVPGWIRGPAGWQARFAAALPQDPAIRGLTVYAQAIFVDRAANRFGAVFSSGLSMTIGGSMPAQLAGHWDSTVRTGFLLAKGTGMVMQFTGVFN